MINTVGLSSKKIGDIGLAAAVSYFVREHFTVNIPLTDSQGYDLIIEKNGLCLRVQVKYTGTKNKYGQIETNLTSTGWKFNSGQGYKHFDKTESDILFVLTGEDDRYVIPTSEITQKRAIVLDGVRGKFLMYKV